MSTERRTRRNIVVRQRRRAGHDDERPICPVCRKTLPERTPGKAGRDLEYCHEDVRQCRVHAKYLRLLGETADAISRSLTATERAKFLSNFREDLTILKEEVER